MTEPTDDTVARMLGVTQAHEVPAVHDQAPYIPCDKRCGPFSMRCVRASEHSGECTGFVMMDPDVVDPSKTVADRLDKLADKQVPGSQTQSDLYAAATVWRKHLRGHSPHLNRDATVAVSPTYTYNEDMSQAPRGVKLILLGASGVAVLTEYNGKNPFWVGWAALPRRAGGGV